VVSEAKLENGVPQTGGWFVVNARESRWEYNELGGYCPFEGEGDARFIDLAINLNWLSPGKPMAMYHAEESQEAFLVLLGECLLIVEGEERPLRRWDFFHCPSWTEHTILGAGNGPSLVLAVGLRGKEGARYPVDAAAIRHLAGVEEGMSPREAYARYGDLLKGPAPDLPA
jgi:mannose-6-phosphate isomerase-like protein (cupin superfamily)